MEVVAAKPVVSSISRAEKKKSSHPHGASCSAHGGAALVIIGAGEAVLVHDPVRFDALGRPAAVEDECLLDADVLARRRGQDGLVGAGGLPVAGPGCAVGADAVGVLAVSRAEEVPLRLPENRLGCMKEMAGI